MNPHSVNEKSSICFELGKEIDRLNGQLFTTEITQSQKRNDQQRKREIDAVRSQRQSLRCA